MNLAEHTDLVAGEAAFWIEALDNPNFPLTELGQVSRDLSVKFRALAIIALTVGGSSDSFCHNLIRSARCRLGYLERVNRERQFNDYHYCSGRYEPLADAIVAGEWGLARRLTELVPSDFRLGYEYEDDFCFAQILARWIVEPVMEGAVPALLERFEAYTDGQPNVCLAVCRAVAARDQAAFDDSFTDLLNARDLEIEAAKARGQLEEPHVIAQRRVFVEGLAILRLAERRGLRTEREYRYCPSLARLPMQTPFPGE